MQMHTHTHTCVHANAHTHAYKCTYTAYTCQVLFTDKELQAIRCRGLIWGNKYPLVIQKLWF